MEIHKIHKREMQKIENRAKEVNPCHKKIPSSNSKTHLTSPIIDQLAICHFRAKERRSISSANTTREQKPHCQNLLAPAPFPRIAPHPLWRAGLCVTCLVQVSLPGISTRSFVFFPSLFPPGPLEAWAIWTIQGVPLHTEPTSFCSAPLSTTNNHSSPPLIETLNNQEQVPNPPTKQSSPHHRAQLPLTQACAGISQKLLYLHGKLLSQKQLWANGGQHEFQGSPHGRECV